MIQIITDILKS